MFFVEVVFKGSKAGTNYHLQIAELIQARKTRLEECLESVVSLKPFCFSKAELKYNPNNHWWLFLLPGGFSCLAPCVFLYYVCSIGG